MQTHLRIITIISVLKTFLCPTSKYMSYELDDLHRDKGKTKTIICLLYFQCVVEMYTLKKDGRERIDAFKM